MNTRTAILAACALATLGAADAARPARLTREQMEARLAPVPRWRFVYGTADAAFTPVLRTRAVAVARRLFGADSSQIVADTAVTAAVLGRGPVVLLGGPRQNRWTARWADRLPLRFTARGFHFQGTDYEESGDAIHLVWPHPLAREHFLLLLAGNSPQAMGRRGGGFFFGGDDYRIVREGELARSGRFSQDPARAWTYDAALDRDREAERRRFAGALVEARSAALALMAPEELHRDGTVARVMARGAELATRWGAPPSPVRLTLYAGLEQKGDLTRDTRPEHVDREGASHAAVAASAPAPDLWSWGAVRFAAALGVEGADFAQAAGTWMAQRCDGEALAVAVSRLWFGRLLPDAAEAAARGERFRSPRRLLPARALLCAAVLRAGGRAALARAIGRGEGTLDSLCAAARVGRPAVERGYVALADSLARAGRAAERVGGPRAAPARPGFERGVCLAHAVDMHRGYLSARCMETLAELRGLGADCISLTPFGYLPGLASPEIYPSTLGGPDEENDESVAEAAAWAHAQGLRVQLKPHLWSRGWVGEIDPGSPAGWKRFFEHYREFVLHYALLAQRHGIESFCVGHELKSATGPEHEAEWRALIAAVRNVYRGALTYGANWDEVERVPFWDALDAIGVSFYYPLAESHTRDPAALRAGADRALARLEILSRRLGKPVCLVEAGYASTRDAPLRPWEEQGAPADPEVQRACYDALIEALERRPWVAGVYWWKWFTDGSVGGPRDASFTPQRKPARESIRRAFARWKERVVRVG